MDGQSHYRAAEALLVSCQLPNIDESYELYPALEDDGEGRQVHSTAAALAAAQVHATLALAAAEVGAWRGES
jgi:hypothetical protein